MVESSGKCNFPRWAACILIVLMPACSGSSWSPKNNGKISVDSKPSGASVYVMRKLVGTTPTVVNVNTMYPATYLQENEQYYGHITLTHKGCSGRTIKLNSQMLSDGLNEKLDCAVDKGLVVDVPSIADKSVTQRLKELQILKDDGLISEEEYRTIRARILDSL